MGAPATPDTNYPTLLKRLLREQHLQKYATFCREYERVAKGIGPELQGTSPSRGQYARWIAGHLAGLPHPDACRVLVKMFGGAYSAEELFAPSPARSDDPEDEVPAAELEVVRPSIIPAQRQPPTVQVVVEQEPVAVVSVALTVMVKLPDGRTLQMTVPAKEQPVDLADVVGDVVRVVDQQRDAAVNALRGMAGPAAYRR